MKEKTIKKFRTKIEPNRLIGVGEFGETEGYKFGMSSHTGYIEIDGVDTEVLYCTPCNAPEKPKYGSVSVDCYRVLSVDRVVFIEED